MPKMLFKENRKYTFSDYFLMGNPGEEIVAEFGYAMTAQTICLPHAWNFDRSLVENLRSSYYDLAPKVSMNSETAKREFMISPLLQAVVRTLDAKLNIEYPLDIDEKLSGTIDYLVRARQELVVIEAKKGDLERGFNQLAVEMIAVDKYEDAGLPPIVYGAVTIGEVWRFAVLQRADKRLTKDLHTFRFPEDMEELFAILQGILTG
jgi:hypothetical protein